MATVRKKQNDTVAPRNDDTALIRNSWLADRHVGPWHKKAPWELHDVARGRKEVYRSWCVVRVAQRVLPYASVHV
ncbi:hypothetical protein E2C01_022264 [Portunus trituberculatus]|uniref:Uncharacterized protein n=1 Tax=Portunus trituberculatus TaxID=210409 RepID=A0A5B7E6T7_PORTR|nr:hypothetical protein [Portunus trituberculatus]